MGERGVATAAAAGLLLLAGCGGGDLTPVRGCESAHGIEVACGLQNPEDLAPSPDGRLIVSQFGGMEGERPGSLALYDPATRSVEVAFPAPGAAGSGWGEPDCAPPDPARFAPHGLDLERRSDGLRQLAVVNHGGRESVELFEVGDDGSLTWRGCAEAPEGAYLNDVVLLRDGGFWATHMSDRGSVAAPLLAALGVDTGFVYAWSAADGFARLPGSDAPFPNGIEKSDDERFAYVNTYARAGVLKLDVAGGEVVASHPIVRLDNSSWTSDGRLLVASHVGGIRQLLDCFDVEEGACGMPFEIVALDPDLERAEVVLRHRGAPMGGVTIALEHDGALYLGTFAGDRIGRVAEWGP